MEKTLTNFIRSLETQRIRVSTAETLDALSAVELVGYRDKEFLKDSLSIVLPKTLTKKKLLRPVSTSFSPLKTFLGRALRIQTQRKTAKKARDPKAGEGGSAGGERQNRQARRQEKQVQGQIQSLSLIEEEEEEDLGPGEMTDPKSELGKLLFNNSVVELTTKMAAAGEAVDVREIQVFTQRAYTRVE